MRMSACVVYVSALIHVEPTCKEKARKAGMGTRAAMKNAIMLLTDVSATLVPVRRKQSPVLSFKKPKKLTSFRGEESSGVEWRGEERRHISKVP